MWRSRGCTRCSKLSPTNLGMLVERAAGGVEFGFLTCRSWWRRTLGTLATYDKLEKQRGHIYNWYDIQTLQAIPPIYCVGGR